MEGKKTTILVPIDTNEDSKRAVDEAISIAQKHGCYLRIFHVVDTKLGAGIRLKKIGSKIKEDLIKSESHIVTDICKMAEEAEIEFDKEIVEGNPVREIIRESEDVDMIVMCRHVHSRVEEFLMGDVTEKVLRHAKCNVMVIEPEGQKVFR